MEKTETRERIARAVSGLTLEQRSDYSRAALRRLLDMPQYREAGMVMAFISMDDEVQTRRLMEDALDSGKRVAVPKVNTAERVMEAHEVTGLDDDFRPGTLGIPVPATRRLVSPSDLDFIVVPARAVDFDGNRLGRGGGYYDRYMSSDGFRAFKCAVVFDTQILPEVPCDGHDVKIDAAATEARLLCFAEDGGSGQS